MKLGRKKTMELFIIISLILNKIGMLPCIAQEVDMNNKEKKIKIMEKRSMNVELQSFLKSYSESIRVVLKDAEKYEVQILYTEIRGNEKEIHLIPYTYRVNSKNYFYPASAIKISTALFALEKMYDIGGVQPGDILESKKSKDYLIGNNGDLMKYIDMMIKRSDNGGYNRLYEFIGQKNYNKRLKELELNNSRILHRFMEKDGKVYSKFQNKVTNEVNIFRDDKIILKEKCRVNDEKYEELNDNEIYVKDKKFLFKNRFDIEDLQKTLLFSIYNQRDAKWIKITDENRRFLKECLKGDGTGQYKYFICGGTGNVPKGIEVYNKIGRAYGYLIDNAYIVDKNTGKCFFVTAVINTGGANPRYRYNEIGMPFLKDLGRGILEYEIKKVQ